MSRFYVFAGLMLAFFSHAMALDVNQASEAELDGLRGIGPPFTRRLMAARAQHPFKDWPDLMQRVSGMGPRVAQSLSDQGLTVQGLPLPSSLSAKKTPSRRFFSAAKRQTTRSSKCWRKSQRKISKALKKCCWQAHHMTLQMP